MQVESKVLQMRGASKCVSGKHIDIVEITKEYTKVINSKGLLSIGV